MYCNPKLYLQVLAMVEGRDRRPELGYKLAMELKNAMKDKIASTDNQWTFRLGWLHSDA